MGDQSHPGAEAGKGLGQLTADRAATDHQQVRRRLPQLPDRVRGEVIQRIEPGDGRHPGPGTAGDDDTARGERPAVDRHLPGREDAGVALHAIYPQRGKSLHRVVGLDGFHHRLHPLHHLPEIHLHRHRLQAELRRATGVIGDAGGADQGLAGHAARIQAVAAHLVALDQCHLRLHRRRDQRRHQPRRAGADDDHVGIKAARAPERRKHPARLDGCQQPLRQQREHRQQHKGQQQAGRDDTGGGLQFAQAGAGVHIGRCRRQHAQLRYPVITPGPDRQQAHQQVDNKEGEYGDQAQGKQIKGALLFKAGIHRTQLPPEFVLHPVPQQQARYQEGQGRPDTAGEGHQQQGIPEAEQRAARQGHDCRARHRQGGYGDIQCEVEQAGQRGVVGVPGARFTHPLLQRVELQVTAEAEVEPGGDGGGNDCDYGDFLDRHLVSTGCC